MTESESTNETDDAQEQDDGPSIIDRAADSSSLRVRNRRLSFDASLHLDREIIEEITEAYGEDEVHTLVKSVVKRHVREQYNGLDADVAIQKESPYLEETYFRVLVVA